MISRFHGVLGRWPVLDREWGTAELEASPRKLMKRPRRKKAVKPEQAAAEVIAAEYLSYEQVCVLWDAASFMAQQFGIWFNMRVTIRHVGGVVGDKTAAEIVGTLLQRLSMKMRGHGAWHWIYVHEFGLHGRTDILLHVPDEQRVEVRRWLLDNFRRRHLPSSDSQNLRVGRVMDLLGVRRHRLHFQYMQYLCRGLNPDCGAQDEHGREGAVLNLLRVPSRWRRPIGAVPPDGRVSGSQRGSARVRSVAATRSE